MTANELTLDDLAEWLRRYAQIVDENKAYLTELDSAIGDADHGANMARGTAAVVTTLDQAQSIDALLKKAGMTLVSTVGGTSGPLYGTLLMKMGMATGQRIALHPDEFGKAFRAGVEGVIARGKTELGDKTMIDALVPSIDAFDAALADGAGLHDAVDSAQQSAAAGRDATIPMVARKGRASYLGERSAGHLDPGATSATYLWDALADLLGV
ncbi:MAG: dihydroxyacetone kinase subunit DhaL [Propionibacteriaceae bacterium]|nr:dihydroxyacetone kinase subunit DhaL [Propionibacteriaceae bacterium]